MPDSGLRSSEAFNINQANNNFERLLRPQSVAVYGGHFAQTVIHQCEKFGYAGKIWPVHPRRDEVCGYQCYRNTESLPGKVDAAFIGVNRHHTIEIVEQLNQFKAGGAICYASGFRETGNDDLNQRLIKAASNMPVLGPNCYGFINYLDGALLWPDQHGGRRVDKGVAVLMQSSNIAINLTMNKRGLPIGYLIALGNQALVGMSDMIQLLCKDERVSAIGLHVEGLDDVCKFTQAVQIAHQYKKPIVVLKAGRFKKGAEITLTHTASMSSSDDVMSAFYTQLGVAQVESISVFIECLKIFHVHGGLKGNDMVSLSCSGGEASLISDASESRAVVFKDFTKQDIDHIKPTVNELVHISNPFDYHTFDWANHDRLYATFDAVMQSGFSINALVMDFPREDKCDLKDWYVSLAAWKSAAKHSNSKSAIISSLPESMPEVVAIDLMNSNIVPLCDIEDSLSAIASAAQVNLAADFRPLQIASTNQRTLITLDEWQSKKLIAEYGIEIPLGYLCANEFEACDAAKKIGYPVVAKSVSGNLAHKTEADALKINLRNEKELLLAYDSLTKLSDKILIEKMIESALAEMIIGLNNDNVVGFSLLIGAGGVLAELLDDTVTIILPMQKSTIENKIMQLKVTKLLTGFRGKPDIGIQSLVSTVMKLQDFIIDQKHQLHDFDINPLIINSTGNCIAADALIRKVI